MVAPDKIYVVLFVVKGESEDSVQILEEIRPLLLIERKNHLAVGLRSERIFALVAAADFLVIVNLAVHGENHVAVGADKRLLAGKRIDNSEALVAQNRVVAGIHA